MASDALGTVEILALMTRVRNDHIITTEKAEFFEEKLDAVFKELNLTFRETVRKLTHDFIDIAGVTTITPEWKFMVVSFYCLHLLDREMRKDELLSVAQTKVLKNYVAAMIDIGILQNLIPTLPHFKLLRTNKLGIQCQYYMLKASVCGLFKYAMLPTLRYHLLHNFMAGSLVALIQLSYCPVKKPLSNIEDEFIMSEEFYGELLGDQDRFQGFITIIQNTVSPMSLMRDAMLLFTTDTPLWFRKGVSRILTNGIKRKDGLLNVMSTIIHVDPKNTTIALKKVQAISQIVVILCTNGDNKDYMYPQIDNLLTFALTSSENMLTILEHLYATIVISLYPVQKAQAELFVDKLLSPLKKLSNETDSEEQKTFFGKEEVMQIIRVTFYIFLDTKNISMPLKLLEPYISILFNIYSCIPDSESIKIKSDLHDIIIHFMKTSERPMVNLLLENFLFNFKIPEVLSFREDIIIRVDASMVQIDFSEKRTKHEVVKNAHKIYNLCKSEVTLFYRYFGFLLNCLCHADRYFINTSLLESEDEGNLSSFERKIAVFEILSILSEDGHKKNYFSEKIPEEMFDYFKEVIINAMKTGAHKNSSDPTFQLVFTVVMILEQILTTQDYKLEELKVNEPIKALASETSSSELKVLCEKIISCDCKDQSKMKKEYLQSIVEDVYNESIEIKGHGLIALKRLVLSKDATTYEHRQYIFTIFKENLSYPDSYIYLAAINGLASLPVLGTECTNMVLETLCEEYTNFPKEVFKDDTNEMRLKVGEVLVQISKNLDEMAPTYKALLLNTFLNGTKDEDHLIRASSLSNLGEICKVLGYKLGSIVTEILMCVHSIISTDKHLEPRRAAILVIRQLLTGLGKDMLTVLKDDILVIYRTLKFLYENDGDDVSKLQTQLALEELNKNMKDLIFPQVKIDTINKVVILK